MHPIPARSEQFHSSFFTIIRTALRAAAIAPDERTALDITGAALIELADLAKAEASDE